MKHTRYFSLVAGDGGGLELEDETSGSEPRLARAVGRPLKPFYEYFWNVYQMNCIEFELIKIRNNYLHPLKSGRWIVEFMNWRSVKVDRSFGGQIDHSNHD